MQAEWGGSGPEEGRPQEAGGRHLRGNHQGGFDGNENHHAKRPSRLYYYNNDNLDNDDFVNDYFFRTCKQSLLSERSKHFKNWKASTLSSMSEAFVKCYTYFIVNVCIFCE